MTHVILTWRDADEAVGALREAVSRLDTSYEHNRVKERRLNTVLNALKDANTIAINDDAVESD